MDSTHHAVLVRDNSVEAYTIEHLSSESEVTDQFIERFGIDDARELVRLAHNRPVNTNEMTLVIRTEFITHEAQNALLKVFEEPPVSTKFVLIIPTALTILPTLQSRLSEDGVSDISIAPQTKEIFDSFLKADYKDRLAAIEKAAKGKDLDWQRAIKQGLVYYTATKAKKDETLSSIEYVARTLLTRGASNKMLLEHVALII